jgi:hypothetical protein
VRRRRAGGWISTPLSVTVRLVEFRRLRGDERQFRYYDWYGTHALSIDLYFFTIYVRYR